MPSGGKRKGAGPKPKDPSGEKRRTVRLFATEAEEAELRRYLQELRDRRKD